MNRITHEDLLRIFLAAGGGAGAIRSIVPYYRPEEGSSEANRFIFERTVEHFRANGKPDGVYRLGHGLELVLGGAELYPREAAVLTPWAADCDQATVARYDQSTKTGSTMLVTREVEKVRAHTDHLLSFYLTVDKRWRLTRELLFNEYSTVFTSDASSHGFEMTREVLFLSVVQDLAGLLYDSYKKTPSIERIYDKLKQNRVTARLREDYVGAYEGERGNLDPGTIRSLTAEREVEFDEAMGRIYEQVPNLLTSEDAIRCKKARDEWIAHFEVSLEQSSGSYFRKALLEYGLEWETPHQLLTGLRPVVIDLSAALRSAGFAWDMFDEQSEMVATEYRDTLLNLAASET